MSRVWSSILLACLCLTSLRHAQTTAAQDDTTTASSTPEQVDKVVEASTEATTVPVAAQQRQPRHEHAKVCVVIRTYWGHGGKAKQGLRQLLSSLERQVHHNWEGVIIVMDTKPFDDLYDIIAPYGQRVWVYADLVGGEYASRAADNSWNPDYHGNLYNLTDQAIRGYMRDQQSVHSLTLWGIARKHSMLPDGMLPDGMPVCSRDSEWLLVTNGDNEYSSNLFQVLEQAPPTVDLVAFDFYSRYQRATGPACYRFAAVPEGGACKVNRLKWCHTDLGANAFAYGRFVGENRRFGMFQSENHTADHYDGLMLESLVASGWEYQYLNGQCLYEHSPSPQRCARLGGVWDDAVAATWTGTGGRCITPAAAQVKLDQEPNTYEIVRVPLSHDNNLASFAANHPEEINCIRYAAHEQHHLSLQLFFGPNCADDVDSDAYPLDKWDEYQAELLAQAEAADAYWREQVAAAERGELVAAPLPPPPPINWQAVPKPPPKRTSGKPKYRQKFKPEASAEALKAAIQARSQGHAEL